MFCPGYRGEVITEYISNAPTDLKLGSILPDYFKIKQLRGEFLVRIQLNFEIQNNTSKTKNDNSFSVFVIFARIQILR